MPNRRKKSLRFYDPEAYFMDCWQIVCSSEGVKTQHPSCCHTTRSCEDALNDGDDASLDEDFPLRSHPQLATHAETTYCVMK